MTATNAKTSAKPRATAKAAGGPKRKAKPTVKTKVGAKKSAQSERKVAAATVADADMVLDDDALRAPGRPRCPAAHQAILDAAAELLETLDYQKITIERIAAQAKVGKPTIYRWWKTKADLILEAYRDESLRRLPRTEPTDDPISDLEDHLKRLFRIHRSRPTAQGFRALIAEGQLDPQFREKFNDRFLVLRRSYVYDVIAHGQKLGHFRQDIDADLVVDILLGAFWYRLLSAKRKPFNDAFAEELVALVRLYLDA